MGSTVKELKKRYWAVLERYRDYSERREFIRSNLGNNCVCNLCRWSGSKWYEKRMGSSIIENVCPKCDSKPRQRILKAVLEKEDFIHRKASVLHVSPSGEKGIADWMRSQRVNYLSIDIQPGKAMKVMDLTHLEIPDSTIDVVVCCHVLEHIENDVQAIEEIYRILRNKGVAVFQIPLYGEATEKVETPTLDDHYHVWHPGLDYSKRYERVGFKVRTIGVEAIDINLIDRLSLRPTDTVELCIKPQ